MNILMVNVPFSGHINPTLALAEELITKIVCGKRKLSTENILTEITKVPVNANIVYTAKDFQINKEEFGEEYCFVGPMIGKRKCDTKTNAYSTKFLCLSLCATVGSA